MDVSKGIGFFALTATLVSIGVVSHAQDTGLNKLREEAAVLRPARQGDGAMIVADQVNQIAEKPKQPDEAEGLRSLAVLYHTQGKFAEAEPLFKRALAIREKALGPNSPDLAVTLDDLVDLYRSQGNYAQAVSFLKRSLSIREQALGPDHPEVAKSLATLAEIYLFQGNIVQVEPLLRRSLTISEKGLGPDHPDVALSLSGLADLYAFQNRGTKAETFFNRSLGIREKKLGKDHPTVAATLNHIAEFYRTHGMSSKAEPLNKRAMAIYMKVLGQDHPDVALTLNNLACVYHDQERYSEAEPLFDRSLEIQGKALDPNHPDVAVVLANLAKLYRATDRVAMAKKLEKRVDQIRATRVIPEAPAVRTEITESQVKEFLNKWETAQTNGFYSDYETMYAKGFYGKQRSSFMAFEFTHDTWLKEKRGAFRWKMAVKISAPEIRIYNKTATVNFEETMDNGTDVTKGLKLLQVINEGGKLKITREEMLFSRIVPEHSEKNDKPVMAGKKKVGVGSGKTKISPLSSEFTSLRFQDCSTKLPPPVATYFKHMSLDVLHCPGPKDWDLFIRSGKSFEISHGRSIWLTASELRCDFGTGECVSGTKQAEWRVTKSGEPKALIFRIFSQDKKQFKRVMSPGAEIKSEHTAYQSRMVVIKFRNGEASLCGTYAKTEQEAREIADNPDACATILPKVLLPKPITRKSGIYQNQRKLTL